MHNKMVLQTLNWIAEFSLFVLYAAFGGLTVVFACIMSLAFFCFSLFSIIFSGFLLASIGPVRTRLSFSFSITVSSSLTDVFISGWIILECVSVVLVSSVVVECFSSVICFIVRVSQNSK